jgi:hypothetical protein
LNDATLAAMTVQDELKKVRAELRDRGWLMEADSKLPSIVTLIVGRPLRGSWWGHAKGHVIFQVCGLLDDDRHVLCLKLINGKRTYVHRKYWKLVLNLIYTHRASARAGLSAGARKLLDRIDKQKSLRSDDPLHKQNYAKLKPYIKELEQDLLCHSQAVHSPSGFHITELTSWETLLRQRRFKLSKLDEAKTTKLLVRFAEGVHGKLRFPWS